MDYAATLQQLLEYYANLLIIQYNGKSKASATIKMLANLILANLVILQIRDGFSLESAELSIDNYGEDEPGIEDVYINKFTFQKHNDIDNQAGLLRLLGGLCSSLRTQRPERQQSKHQKCAKFHLNQF